MSEKIVTIDYETEAIGERPRSYPPKPVGVAIKYGGRPGKYLAWGHPTGNNTTKAKALEELKDIRRSGASILYFNDKFDQEVELEHFGLPILPWDRAHDAMLSLFLKHPHANSLSLKPASEEILGWKPTERDAVYDWLAEHGIIAKPRIKDGVLKYPKDAGAFISKAPGDLVGKYAIGDVDRTYAMHMKCYVDLDAKEREAYDRERRLMPILLRNEQLGMRVDVEHLEPDLKMYEAALEKADNWLHLRLGSINIDSDEEVAAALKKKKIVTYFVKTPTGKDSVAKKNLKIEMFKDRTVGLMLGYRNRLTNVLTMSMRPWLETAAFDGHVYTDWSQVRQSKGPDGSKGARTGRLQCPRFMNVTKDYMDKGDGYQHPTVIKLPQLPLVRRYLLPDLGGMIVHRDYDQQEFRILAHFEDGDLMKSYQKNPKIDYHEMMREMIKTHTGQDLPRPIIKTLNFGILYGMGAALLAEKLGMPVREARKLRDAIKRAAPGVKRLDEKLKQLGRDGKAIRTWGGRRYFCEPPHTFKSGPRKGQQQTFEYKLLNYIVQGSAADCTKEAIIRLHDEKFPGRFLITVHDEINLSVPLKGVKEADAVLQRVMKSIEFDVPMLSSPKVGPTWGDLAKVSQ